MGSEGFGSFGKSRPVMCWNLNALPFEDKPEAPNNSPEFVIDEKMRRLGMRALVGGTWASMDARLKVEGDARALSQSRSSVEGGRPARRRLSRARCG